MEEQEINHVTSDVVSESQPCKSLKLENVTENTTCTLQGGNSFQTPMTKVSSMPVADFQGQSTSKNVIEIETISRPKRVILNVGGEKHEMLWDNLNRYKQSRLGQLRACINDLDMLKLCDDYSKETNEFFFDRSPRSLSLILNLYRKNKLHLPDDMCFMDFMEELQYWGIDDANLDSCCSGKYLRKKEQFQDEIKKDNKYFLAHQSNFGTGRIASFRAYLWGLFEESKTVPQKVTGGLSITMIALSIITLCLSTLPELREFKCKHDNVTICDEGYPEFGVPSDSEDFEEINNVVLSSLEIVCVGWFTIEYLVRLFASPIKQAFFLSWLNIIDLFSIVPFYISLFLDELNSTGRILQVLRAIRIMRIFKLARHSTGLQCLGYTLKHSYQYMGVLLLFLGMGVIIFSTLAYFAENQDNVEGFQSIPQTFYWALITMTTIGYGDVSPVTIFGKVIASMAGISGVICIALPIPTVVNNFTIFYEEHKRKQIALKRQKALLKMKRGVASLFNMTMMVSLGAENVHKNSNM